MGLEMKTSVFVGLCAMAAFASEAHAQSSVTLYGVLDDGLNYTSNANGHHGFAMVSGETAETSFGLKGNEDLGGGVSAVFTLENGVNTNTGGLNEGNRLFGRQAFVGLSSQSGGTLTIGRQYDATIDMWSGFTGAGNEIGDLAAHPYDNDNADYDYRFDNSIKYASPVLHGFQAEAVYGFSNSTNFASNRAYSAAVNYTAGPFSAVVAYMRQTAGGTTLGGGVGADDVFAASRQQNIDAGVKWTLPSGSNVALAYSHVVADDPTANVYVADIGSQSWTRWKFDNIEVNGQYFIRPDFFVAGAYTFTRANFTANATNYASNWHQVSVMAEYMLSKRTAIYAQGAWQHTNGKTGTGLDSAVIVGSVGPSSTGNQMVYRLAMVHHF